MITVHMPLAGSLWLSLLLIVPAWRIFARAGLMPALSLVVFIPLVGVLIAAALLGLSRWVVPGEEAELAEPPAGEQP